MSNQSHCELDGNLGATWQWCPENVKTKISEKKF